jgi:hypothetical protein
MRKVTEAKCTDGVVWIVKEPGRPFEYSSFETEAAAQRYALERNREDEERSRLMAEAEEEAAECAPAA